MSNQPASDRALRGALSLPGVNAGASRAILVNGRQQGLQKQLVGWRPVKDSPAVPLRKVNEVQLIQVRKCNQCIGTATRGCTVCVIASRKIGSKSRNV